MRELAQRRAIAKVCGWRWIESPDDSKFLRLLDGKDKNKASCLKTEKNREKFWRVTPDYLTDIKAMREVVIDNLAYDESLIEIFTVTLKDLYIKQGGYQGTDYWFLARTSLWAEAFLRTLGLWQEETT